MASNQSQSFQVAFLGMLLVMMPLMSLLIALRRDFLYAFLVLIGSPIGFILAMFWVFPYAGYIKLTEMMGRGHVTA